MTTGSSEGKEGIVSYHDYTILGTEEKDGQQFVILRNPWGNFEPGNDGKDDGVFKLSYEDFKKYFFSVDVAKTPADLAASKRLKNLPEPVLTQADQQKDPKLYQYKRIEDA